MWIRRFVRLLVIGLAVVSAAACSKNAGPPPSAPTSGNTAGSEDSASARLLPLPGQGLPPGHPSTGAEAPLLQWSVPDHWDQVPPASAMRRAQYRVPGSAGDGECIVYYFGAGQGGDAMSNAVRWARQFRQPDGSDSSDAMQVTALEGTAVPVQLVEVTGTYDGGMTMTDAPPEQKEGYMLLGSIVQGPDAPWFFKFTGPEATVREQREAFVAMMKSIRLGT